MTTRFGTRIGGDFPVTVSGQGGGGTTCPPTFVFPENQRRSDVMANRLLLPERLNRSEVIRLNQARMVENQNRKDLGIITLTGAPVFMSISTTTQTVASNSITLTKPVGIVAGDLMVAFMARGSISAAITFTPPAGWTEIHQTATGGALGSNAGSFWKIATGSEPADYTFTDNPTTSTSAHIGWIMRFIATHSTTPIDAATENSGNAADPTALSVTTSVANCTLIACCGQQNALAATYTPPASYIERADQNSTSLTVSQHTGEANTRVRPTAGASGNAVMNSSQILASDFCAHHIAIRGGTSVITV